MTIETSAVYNEPRPAPFRDLVPALPRFRAETLKTPVQARLQLESHLRSCGLAQKDTSDRFRGTKAQQQVMLHMLAEADSPLSASLRASVAAMAGAANLTLAAPLLRRMVRDEKEDRRTRLGAIHSFVALSKERALAELKVVLRSSDGLVRAAAIVAAFRSGTPKLVGLAQAAFERERDVGVRQALVRRVPKLSAETSTSESEPQPAARRRSARLASKSRGRKR